MNSFGRIFRVSIFGESHGPSVGVVIDGCPPGMELTEADFAADLENAGKVVYKKEQRREKKTTNPFFSAGCSMAKPPVLH
jgi:chorismate synthase